MYGALRRMLFKADPERAHHLALGALAAAQRNRLARSLIAATDPSPRLAQDLLGQRFPGPLGMAAGFDKEAVAYNTLLALGFSHVEIGTVTPLPQPGNDRPRLQRLPDHQALVNRLGFPGPGAEVVSDRLTKRPPEGIVAANIGPNKRTPAKQVVTDITTSAQRLAVHVAFLTVNVSSPNTPGLRALQTPAAVARLVGAANEAADSVAAPRPVLVKVHPDAPDEEILAVAQAAVDAGAAGIVAVNTTKERPVDAGKTLDGGLSGAPLKQRARDVVAHLYHGLGRDMPIIGVGGIATAADAFAMIRAGASLLQTYTGFIYEGPRMATRVHDGLLQHLDAAGMDHLDEAVGAGPARGL